jgi:t-SNARE complex subunit (syntaxin)
MSTQIIQIDELNDCISKLKKLYIDQFYNPVDSINIKKQISELLFDINDLALEIHDDLKSNNTYSKEFKQTQYKSLQLSMKNLSDMCAEYNSKIKTEAIRRIRIIDENIILDESTISNDCVDKYLLQSMVTSDRHSSRDDNISALIHLKEYKQDVVELEKVIIELQQIFIDFACIIESQGEHVDNITHNVDNAKMYVEEGGKQLKKAREYKTKERKKCCCLATCGVCTVIGAGLATGLTAAKCSVQ